MAIVPRGELGPTALIPMSMTLPGRLSGLLVPGACVGDLRHDTERDRLTVRVRLGRYGGRPDFPPDRRLGVRSLRPFHHSSLCCLGRGPMPTVDSVQRDWSRDRRRERCHRCGERTARPPLAGFSSGITDICCTGLLACPCSGQQRTTTMPPTLSVTAGGDGWPARTS